ncbi:MAG TPA: PilZ domain-containing protein [Thermoanaerobaculaceae bacterium]|nr:PilZ domain-containing protein [Thermoanaerobaculaceae bacterium]HRS16267.1 PilZ domain-containing protein [Thermoanaerobaculaceae bacterium]
MPQELLLVGPEAPVLGRVVPLLERADFRVQHVPRGDEAVALVRERAFDLIIARFPLVGAGLAEFVRAVRGDGQPCRNAGFLLLAEPEYVAEVGGFLGRGVGRIVSLDVAADKLVDAVAELLAVAPRRSLRALVQVRFSIEHGGGHLLALTHNLSETGLLLSGARELPVGTRLRFELSLPGLDEPIRGEAEVVRHTDPERERVAGVGARILAFAGDGQQRLRGYLREARHP